jgi:LysR family transcriptional regulator, glycine cleavage system transcriptional activator
VAQRLPPLRAIEAFVLAAQHLSITRAAEELGLSVPATSRRIHALEADLGVRLFRRLHRALALTKAGETYRDRLAPAFAEIRAASEAVRAPTRRRTLRINLLQSFAANWLMPRLPRFQALHPELRIELETETATIDLAAREDVDVAIRLGEGPWPGLAAERLITPEVFPVCAPALRRRLRRIDDLARFTWLGSRHLPRSWAEWADAVGHPELTPKAIQDFDNLQLLYEAATGGLGIALGIDVIVAPYLADGRLVAPFPQRVRRSRAYWLVCRKAERDRPPIRAFRDWILGEARG